MKTKRFCLYGLSRFFNAVNRMQIGRYEIFTDELNITEKNVISVVKNAMTYHMINSARIDYLLNYEAGVQPLVREKQVRPEINIVDVDNLAHYITDFKCGYFWGNPITFVQRGLKDKGVKEESEAIALLNECYESENIRAKTQELARFVEIGGIGYVYVDLKNDYVEGDSYFSIVTLDPRNTFIIKSGYYADHRTMAAVSYRQMENGSRHYTIFTKDLRIDVDELALEESDSETTWQIGKNGVFKNPFGVIPIIEYQRSPDRMGCFERQMDEMNYLNVLLSNVGNEQEDETQCIWWANDIEFPVDENGNPIKPQTNEWVQTYTSRDGKTPKITPLTNDHDYASQLNVIYATRARILEECHVPQRNDNSGGSTGVAMADAAGWSDAETDACKEQMTVEACKVNELKVVCEVLKKSTEIAQDSPLLKLRYSDCQPNMKRSKSYELTVKSNAFGTLISHGIAPEHAIRVITLFDDPQQVLEDSKEYLDRYYDREFGSEEEEVQGASNLPENQITNSPLIDGMSKENPNEETTVEVEKKEVNEKG